MKMTILLSISILISCNKGEEYGIKSDKDIVCTEDNKICIDLKNKSMRTFFNKSYTTIPYTQFGNVYITHMNVFGAKLEFNYYINNNCIDSIKTSVMYLITQPGIKDTNIVESKKHCFIP